jgi:hypothetical protein
MRVKWLLRRYLLLAGVLSMSITRDHCRAGTAACVPITDEIILGVSHDISVGTSARAVEIES